MTDAEVARSSTEQRTLICATIGRDGWPHLMPLWYVVRDGECWAWTYAKSQKVRNLERDPRCTLQVETGEEYHELRGVMFKCAEAIHRDSRRSPSSATEIAARYGGGAGDVHALRKQAAKRVGLQFVVRETSAGTTASWAAATERYPARADGAAQGPDPLGRQGHAPAPDHPHVGEAARAGRQQAGAVLRDRGDGGGRHPRGRDHHRPGDRRRDPRGGRRRLALRRRDHLHRAGRAARARARGADRRAVPRQRPVRDVPRRQPAAGRHRGPRGGVPREHARGADPAHAGARPRELRRRRARRRRARRAAGREAAGAGARPRAGRRLHVHAADPRGGARDRAVRARRARDHRRDPVAGRRRAHASSRTSCAAGGRTPAGSTTCSRPTG